MARAFRAFRRLPHSLGRCLAVAFVIFGLFQPRAFVWCQTETGHAALEALDAECCSAPDSEASCSPGLAGESPREAEEGEAMESEGCRDVLVEAPTWIPLDEKSPLAVAAPSSSPFETANPPAPGPAQSGREEGARAASHDLVLSTVLRI